MEYVLIADDDRALTALLENCLRSQGVKVVIAHDASHALFLMQEDAPAIAILDIGMPAGNGLAVCEMMRDSLTLRNIPTIIITGRRDPAALERARLLRAHFVCKGPGLWYSLRPICESHLKRSLVPHPTAPLSPIVVHN